MERSDMDVRWKQRFQNYERAYLRLREGAVTLSRDPTNILMQAGLIQMFEFTFELAWKVMKDFLESEGFQVASPKGTIRQAYQSGYIANAEDWMQALQDRNMTVHTYDDATAQAVVSEISSRYLSMLSDFYDDFKARL